MKKVNSIGKKSNRKLSVRIDSKGAAANEFRWPDGSLINSEHMIISLLLPPAVRELFQLLEKEVEQLCGARYEHGNGHNRWGKQAGSVYLGGQKVAIERPRVRDTETGQEQRLETYERFQDPEVFESCVFRDGLRHVSQRDYERGVERIGGAFGFKKSSISKHWKQATLKELKTLNDRELGQLDIVALFIDGKRFRDLGVVVALGVSTSGKKYTLGVFQANTENASSCLQLLNDLERRGLPRAGLLFIVDGGAGLNSALERKYAVHKPNERLAVRLRCYCHKWRNIEDALGKESESAIEAHKLFWEVRDAIDAAHARTKVLQLKKLLKHANLSALRTFEEAEADLLVLHELKLPLILARLVSTTNPIESLNSLLEEDLRRVKRWHDSEHFQRWLATAALHNEKRMHRVNGYKHLRRLKNSLARLCNAVDVDELKEAA